MLVNNSLKTASKINEQVAEADCSDVQKEMIISAPSVQVVPVAATADSHPAKSNTQNW